MDDGASSSSSADSDVRSSASQVAALAREVARLEQQLREQAAQFRQLSVGGSAVEQQQHPQQARSSQEPLQQVRVAAVQPPELTYAGATAGTALEDWLFRLEQLFVQTHKSEAAWAERAQLAQLYWDRHMSLWWIGRQEAAAAAGAPIRSWLAFVAALRKQFVPAGDSQGARTELFKLRMRSGESVEAYMQRVVLLVTRAGSLMEGRTAAALALEGVDKSRFPFTCAAVARKERAAGVEGMSFAQMREELTVEAAMEPQLGGRGGSSSSGGASGRPSSSSSSSSSGHSGHSSAKGASGSRQVRINALQQQLRALQEDGDEEDASDDSYSTAALAPDGRGSSSGADARCYKCGVTGHISADCKSSKELRTCFRCKQKGHVRSKCPERSGAGKQVEGAGTGASKPAPKNE